MPPNSPMRFIRDSMARERLASSQIGALVAMALARVLSGGCERVERTPLGLLLGTSRSTDARAPRDACNAPRKRSSAGPWLRRSDELVERGKLIPDRGAPPGVCATR